MLKIIPILELGEHDFIDRLIEAFHDIGFVLVRAPEVRPDYEALETGFTLPFEVKMRYACPDIGYQRGWAPEYSETGIYCKRLGDIGQRGVSDSKEMWAMGPEIAVDHPLIKKYPLSYFPNMWPMEAPRFKPAALKIYNALFPYGEAVVRAVTKFIGVDENYFNLGSGQHHHRIISYASVSTENAGNIIWACRHTDINLVTVLPASTRPGLWIYNRAGEEVPGNTPEAAGCVFVQVGDMLRRITAGRLMSAAHEVRAPHEPSPGRMSSPLFIHPAAETLLDASQYFDLTDAERRAYPAITAGDYLKERLKDIGLY